MSKLSELLKSQVPAANPANSANPGESTQKISNFSNISSGAIEKSKSQRDLETRIRAMAKRWGFSADELTEELAAAAADPMRDLIWVERDEYLYGDCKTSEDFAAAYSRMRNLT